MTTRRNVASLLAAALAVFASACDGNHTIGNQDDLTGTTCCFVKSTGQKVASCQGQQDCICSPDICNRGSSCQSDADCPQLGLACQLCSDGKTACPVDTCVKGQCIVVINTCSQPSCTADNQCPAPDACKQCPDGSAACAHGSCGKSGTCEIAWDVCPTPECTMRATTSSLPTLASEQRIASTEPCTSPLTIRLNSCLPAAYFKFCIICSSVRGVPAEPSVSRRLRMR